VIGLAHHLPQLRVPAVALGTWPTPIAAITVDGRPLWIKREGDAHPRYGGNKVRTLEVWLGHAQALGARRIWAIGAYGSNHAVATVVHAPAAGLEAAAMVFPQPRGAWAAENCGALVASGCPLIRLASVVQVPFAAWRLARRERDAVVMPPGGATPIGTMGAVSAVFELADQIAAGAAPPPARIVLAIGSTCTAAGLLAGLSLAAAMGVWRWPVPIVHAVRVTPWPVTSRLRTADLARRTLARIAQLGGPPAAIPFRALVQRLVVDGAELGRGYGRRTEAATAATRDLHAASPDAPRLDGVYSAKAAAALLRLHRAGVGPLLFWASKSTAEMAPPADAALARTHPALAAWLRSQ
jgi:D-cysteine desulfhydrase